MAITVKLPNGQEVLAEQMKYETLNEPWAEYKLKDGVIVRLRATALKILRVVDEEGVPQDNDEGEPFVIVRNARQITATQE